MAIVHLKSVHCKWETEDLLLFNINSFVSSISILDSAQSSPIMTLIHQFTSLSFFIYKVEDNKSMHFKKAVDLKNQHSSFITVLCDKPAFQSILSPSWIAAILKAFFCCSLWSMVVKSIKFRVLPAFTSWLLWVLAGLSWANDTILHFSICQGYNNSYYVVLRIKPYFIYIYDYIYVG